MVQTGLDFSDGGLQYIPEGGGLRTLTMSEVCDAPTCSQLCRENPWLSWLAAGRSWLRVLLGRVLAVVEVIKAWWCSRCDTALAVNVLSTYHSLQYINTQPSLSARQWRWVELLQDCTFKIRYNAGDRNVVADALSRRSDHELAHVQENEARLCVGLSGASGTGLSMLQLEVAAVGT